ncbi:hypothetical protein POX_d05473 [Penicillium oxalicum]|uniref:hypothetical protein n=1 Tax=Penicillium oxalicum TaxID=69781 RepID=UPI0020B84681|nr:hypothetical protein POX_d05473 [Penicillium oxalicum]KAI2789972.1 hypothetical protein POX_d05473 [Penicillium oxalicum]
MNEDPGVQFMGARSKPSQRAMSHNSNESDQSIWHRHFHPIRPDVSESESSQLPPTMTSRDRHDYRQPPGARRYNGNVIDLTNDPESPPQRPQPSHENPYSNTPRLPRFGRNIMTHVDVVDLEQEPDDPGEGPSSSPEVQFVRATTRHNVPPPRWDAYRAISANFPPGGRAPANTSTFGTHRPPRFFGTHNFMPAQLDRLFVGMPQSMPSLNANDVFLDYALSAFSMEQNSTQREEPPPPSTYKPPSPAPEGFARTVGEDEVAICPNCDWELGTGEGKKQEIWVAKQCGHVYCGECVENRSLSKAKKAQGAPKTKPFSKCQVEGCGKPVSAPTAMVHLYL